MLRKQNVKLSEENGKLVGHKNHKQRIEYLVKLKKDNTRLQEVTFLLNKNKCFRVQGIYKSVFIDFFCIFLFVFKENEKLRTEISLMRDSSVCQSLEEM